MAVKFDGKKTGLFEKGKAGKNQVWPSIYNRKNLKFFCLFSVKKVRKSIEKKRKNRYDRLV